MQSDMASGQPLGRRGHRQLARLAILTADDGERLATESLALERREGGIVGRVAVVGGDDLAGARHGEGDLVVCPGITSPRWSTTSTVT